MIDDLEHLLSELKLLQRLRARLAEVRLIHESDEDTLARITKIAVERICKVCRGSRRTFTGICPECNGTGIRDALPG